jgi:hypothetical protein
VIHIEGSKMKNRNKLAAVVLVLTILGLVPAAAYAHCDGLDGPVVRAARQALESGNVNFVLPWVKAADENEIKTAFERTLAVRKLNPQARELADMYFFETLVRIHRAGEGAPYTGLKPAGRDLGPAIPAGDEAIAKGSAESLMALMSDRMRDGLHSRFHGVLAASKYSRDDVAAGREYVNAYVQYIHYVEQLYEAAKGPAGPYEYDAVPRDLHTNK